MSSTPKRSPFLPPASCVSYNTPPQIHFPPLGYRWIILWVGQLLGIYGNPEEDEQYQYIHQFIQRRQALWDFVSAYFAADENHLVRYIPREVIKGVPKLLDNNQLLTYDINMKTLRRVLTTSLHNQRHNILTILPGVEFATRVHAYHNDPMDTDTADPRIYINLVVSVLYSETTWTPEWRFGRVTFCILHFFNLL